MNEVLYTERWHDQRRQPTADSPWLSPEEAAARYDEHRGAFLSVDGTRDGDGSLRPRWTLGVHRAGALVHFRTPHGSIWRAVDYDARDGRLWRWVTYDYTYPDASRFYRRFECVLKHFATFEPDGTGTIEVDDKAKPTIQRARLTEAPVQGLWLDWPEFGHWEDLTNPDYGMPPTLSGGA